MHPNLVVWVLILFTYLMSEKINNLVYVFFRNWECTQIPSFTCKIIKQIKWKFPLRIIKPKHTPKNNFFKIQAQVIHIIKNKFIIFSLLSGDQIPSTSLTSICKERTVVICVRNILSNLFRFSVCTWCLLTFREIFLLTFATVDNVHWSCMFVCSEHCHWLVSWYLPLNDR